MKNIVRILMLSLLCLLGFVPTFAIHTYDANSFIVQGLSNQKNMPSTLQQSVFAFDITSNDASRIFNGSEKTLSIIGFPISLKTTSTITLELTQSCIDASTIFMVGYKQIPIPHVLTYSGSIVGESGSHIMLSYANGDMHGWISRANGEVFVIGPNNSSITEKRPHVLYADGALETDQFHKARTCGTQEYSHSGIMPFQIEAEMKKKGDKTLDNRMLEMQVIVETTSTFFTKIASGNEQKAANYIVSLFNAVNTLYRRELNLNIILPYVQIWTTDAPDPYKNDGADTPALLQEVQNRWIKITNRTRDIVHCLDAQGNSQTGNGTFVAGIANGIDAICSGSVSNAYSVSGISRYTALPTTSYVNDVVTCAHEIGHNIGSFHTHNCSAWKPALDSCLSSGVAYQGKQSYSSETCNVGAPRPVPGSIMSYCDLTNSGTVQFTFLPRVYTFLRANLEKKVCITEVQASQIKMIAPAGNRTFNAGTKQLIEWTSSRVNSVKIQLSTDAGSSWSNIESGLPASSASQINGQGSYQWTVPKIKTDLGRLRVCDITNENINDTTWANFKITVPVIALALTNNLDGKAYGQKESVSLAWTKTNIDSVSILFSSDNGANWNSVSSGQTGSNFQFAMPDITANKCYIRIISADDNGLISQTGPFSVGKEELNVNTPKAGDILCAGKDFIVSWNYKNIAASKLLLQYSTDSGSSWQNISTVLGVDPWTSVFRWRVPTIEAPIAIVRAIAKSDSTIAFVTGAMSIVNSANCSATNIQESNTILPQLSISPNPLINGNLSIKIVSSNLCNNAQLSINSINGESVHTIQKNLDLSIGEHTINASLPQLPSGTYFVSLICGQTKITVPLTIQH